MTAKKCTTKHDARAKLLFCQSKPIAFLPLSLTSPSSLLKLPIDPLSRKRLATLLVSCHSLTERLQNRASHHAQNKQICILASHYVCKLLVEELNKWELLGFSPPPPRRYNEPVRNSSRSQAREKVFFATKQRFHDLFLYIPFIEIKATVNLGIVEKPLLNILTSGIIVFDAESSSCL